MKIVFLKSSSKDFIWFKDYYDNVFTQGKSKAKAHFYSTISTLKNDPYMGKPLTTQNTEEWQYIKLPSPLFII